MTTQNIVNNFSPLNLPIAPNKPWLAPLAGFSDLPFRLLCKELGAAVVCSEMVSAKGLIYGLQKKQPATNSVSTCTAHTHANFLSNSGTEDLLLTHPADAPLVVQLFGAEASFMEQATDLLAQRGYTAFDINMGCSVPKVTKTGAGAAMLKDIPNAVEVTKAMVTAAQGLPVGVKIRRGWNMGDDIYCDLAKRLEDAGAAWITLHPRWAKQSFSGEADAEALQKLVQHLAIPVIASGDLFTAQDAITCIHNTHVNGVMFARGALANPAVFTEMLAKLAGKEYTQTAADLYSLIIRHASLAKAYTPGKPGRKGVSPALLKMRTFVPRYVRHLTGSKQLRQTLAECQGWDHLEEILYDFFTQFGCTQLALTKEPEYAGYPR